MIRRALDRRWSIAFSEMPRMSAASPWEMPCMMQSSTASRWAGESLESSRSAAAIFSGVDSPGSSGMTALWYSQTDSSTSASLCRPVDSEACHRSRRLCWRYTSTEPSARRWCEWLPFHIRYTVPGPCRFATGSKKGLRSVWLPAQCVVPRWFSLFSRRGTSR